MKKYEPLAAESLYQSCDISQFKFKTTAELVPLDQPLGQQRALEAIEFGVDIQQDGFNLFVIGHTGLGKNTLVQQILESRAPAEESPYDWCYVNNFNHPQNPRVLKLPAGMGLRLRKDMKSLIEDLLTALPSSFQSEEYTNSLQEIEDEMHNRREQAFHKINQKAEQEGIGIIRTPGGFTLGPMVNGTPLKHDEYKKLPDAEKDRIEKLIADLQLELQSVIREMPLLQREHHQRVKALNQEITQHTVEQLMAWIEQAYREQPEVMKYLGEVKQHAIENVAELLPSENHPEADNVRRRVEDFSEYSINVIVDNTDTKGAPIVFEDNPTYQNLIGRTEYVAHMGTMMTDFSMIKSGALHRANGGYLILDAHKVLTHAFSWEGLKRALKSGVIRIQSLEQMLGLVSYVSLEPELLPFNVKVVLTGEPILYYLLKEYDHEFDQLFKVAADFSSFTERNVDNAQLYARLIASIQQRVEGRALNRDSVGRVIEHASRMIEDSEKVSLHVASIEDLLVEANYWAGKESSEVIRLQDVEQAISKRLFRQDKYREYFQQQILRGIKLIDTDEMKTGQINALSVLQIGDYMFGQPSRITATARLGRGGVIDIERETKLGGQIHSKGVMILSSYLASQYAADQSLPLAASLVFEQSYGMVDGDSASAAELCALLSALGRIPLKQSMAVTGSINQLGEIQAIGGVNEKIEGFFDICLARGLTGDQAVIIPASNQVHLMLREDIRQMVEQGMFQIYTAAHVEDVMELLSGLPAGKLSRAGNYPRNSFNYKIQQRIRQLRKQEQQSKKGNRTASKKSSKSKKQ